MGLGKKIVICLYTCLYHYTGRNLIELSKIGGMCQNFEWDVIQGSSYRLTNWNGKFQSF